MLGNWATPFGVNWAAPAPTLTGVVTRTAVPPLPAQPVRSVSKPGLALRVTPPLPVADTPSQKSSAVAVFFWTPPLAAATNVRADPQAKRLPSASSAVAVR